MIIINDELKQKTLRQKILYTRIYVMDFNFITVGEITGVVCGYPSYTNDATSDVRRTMTIELCPIESDFDFGNISGSKIWLDKYIRVEVGIQETPRDEITYFNMGTYIIDNPSMTYSATENKITLNCLDLMARLTGIRGGVIEGVSHIIPKNTSVRDAMIAILQEGGISRYVVEDCEILIPNDITIDGGATIYDMLKQLVDLLPNYQIYFDIDGVFHYDMIPNGQHESVMVDDNIWKNTLISYDMNYDFENIKNYIEVIGGVPDSPLFTFEPSFRDTSWEDNPVTHSLCLTPSGAEADEILSVINNIDDASSFTSDMFQRCYIAFRVPEWTFDFTIPRVAITRLTIRDGAGNNCMTLNFSKPLNMNVYKDAPSMCYILLDSITNWTTTTDGHWETSTYNASFMSGEQPHATVFETNPESIFRTGVDYYCSCEWGGRFPIPTAELYIDEKYTNMEESVYGKVFTYNITGLFQYRYGGIMQFAPCPYPEDYAGSSDYVLKLYFQSDEDVNSYELKATLSGTPELLCIGSHTMKFNLAKNKFEPYDVNTLGTLRIVLSGDEYENIWSQDLAEQRAKFELYQRCRLQDNLTITCLPIYWLDTNWLVEITLPNEQSGEEQTAQYLIKSISTDGTMSGTQTVTLVRYYPYYPII